jgi:hypothetical protein
MDGMQNGTGEKQSAANRDFYRKKQETDWQNSQIAKIVLEATGFAPRFVNLQQSANQYFKIFKFKLAQFSLILFLIRI